MSDPDLARKPGNVRPVDSWLAPTCRDTFLACHGCQNTIHGLSETINTQV